MQEVPKKESAKKDKMDIKNPEENIKSFEESEITHFPELLSAEVKNLSKLIFFREDNPSSEEIQVIREKLEGIQKDIEDMICRIDLYTEAKKKIDIGSNLNK